VHRIILFGGINEFYFQFFASSWDRLSCILRWFLPQERALCDALGSRSYVITDFAAGSLTCQYVIRHFFYRYQVEMLNKNPDIVLFPDFYRDTKSIARLNQYTKAYSEQSPVYTLFTDSSIEKKIMESLDFRLASSASKSHARCESIASERAKASISAQPLSRTCTKSQAGWQGWMWATWTKRWTCSGTGT